MCMYVYLHKFARNLGDQDSFAYGVSANGVIYNFVDVDITTLIPN